MVSLSNRTSMALFSDPMDHYSHRVRIVMEEKGVTSEIIDSDANDLSSEILEVSPYAELPVLVDRDVCLYDSLILMEYLDERFPHPPLLPVYPVTRANSRTLMLRIDKEICPLVDKLSAKDGTDKELLVAKEELLHEISAIAPTFKEFPFFMSEEFSLADCYLAPILWRLPSLGINLPLNRHLKPLLDYQAKIFERPGFQDSLSLIEKDLRD